VVGDIASGREAVGNVSTASGASLREDALLGGSVWVSTDGEAEAARSCSSRLGVPTTEEGDDLEKAVDVDFRGAWNGKVDGSGGGRSVSTCGQGRVASLKRRPLQTRAGQWNGPKTTAVMGPTDD
jgi:hypothetical protein